MLTLSWTDSRVACSKEEQWMEATVLDLGSPAVDGCGFVLEINGQIYRPVNLEEQYQIDKKRVEVQYASIDEMYTCGFQDSEVKYPQIDIMAIRD